MPTASGEDPQPMRPTPAQVASWAFPPTPHAAALLRSALRKVLAEWGVPEDARAATELVANELASNAVEHARTALDVRVSLEGACVRVEVRDASPAPPRLQPYDPLALRGRGLQVVDTLSRQWSWSCDQAGKVVWAEVPPGWDPRPPS